MKATLLSVLIILSFSIASCLKDNVVVPSASQSRPSLSIRMSMKDAPTDIASIVGILTRQGYDTLRNNFAISIDSAVCEFDNVAVGVWHLQVNAYDGTNALKYSGRTDVQVFSGQTTPVNLVLNATTGSISITVTWGSGTTGSNKSLVFDGYSGYVDVPDSPSLIDIDSAYTLEAWIKPAGNAFYNYVIAKGAGLQYTMELLSSSLNPAFTLEGVTIDYTGATDYYSRLVLGNTVPAGIWTHLAVTYRDGDGINIYINGNLVHHANAYGLLSHDSGNLRLGVLLNDTYQLYFKGSMDEVRIWRSALTGDQIRSTMNTGLTGTEPNLVACWDFNDSLSSSTVSDKSLFGNNGKLVGGVTFSADTPF